MGLSLFVIFFRGGGVGGGLKNVLICEIFIQIFYFDRVHVDIVCMGCYQGQADQDQGQQLHHHRQDLLIKVEDLISLETGLHLAILC